MLQAPTESVVLQTESYYEETIECSSAQYEQGRKLVTQDELVKLTSESERSMNMFGINPRFYVTNGQLHFFTIIWVPEGRLVINGKNLHCEIDQLSTVHLWQRMETAFIRLPNQTFDRFSMLTTKNLCGKTVEHFYGKLKELAENCQLENGESLFRDVFIAKLTDIEALY